MNNFMKMLQASTVVLLGTLLVACGGGGGGGDSTAVATAPGTPVVVPPVITPPVVTPPVLPPAFTLASMQGFWDAAPVGTSRMNAVILPNGTTWVVQEAAGIVTALAKVSLNTDGTTFSNTGQYYNLPNGAVQDYRFTGSLPSGPRGTLQTTIGIGSGATATASWTYNSSYDTPVNQRDTQARWAGSLDVVNVLWDIDATGNVAGTSTTGCNYSGTLAVNASAPAVLDVAISESCAGKQQSLNGIARFSADKAGLSIVYTTAAGARGGVIVLRK